MWLFKMADVPLKRYGYHRPRPNPYLVVEGNIPEWDREVPVKGEWWNGTTSPEQREKREPAHKVKAEAEYTCQRCGRSVRKGEVEEIDMHHRVPRRKKRRRHPDNVEVLCPECHLKAHKGNWQR